MHGVVRRVDGARCCARSRFLSHRPTTRGCRAVRSISCSWSICSTTSTTARYGPVSRDVTRSDRLLALGARVMNAAVALAIALAGISDAVRPHLGPIPRPFGQILIEVGLYGSFFGAAVAFAALNRPMARPRGVPFLIGPWILAFYARRFPGG